MTFILLKEISNFKCAVLIGAISNLKQIADSDMSLKKKYEHIIGSNDFDLKLQARSAIRFSRDLPDIPYLIMHGGKDERVPVEQSIKLAKKYSQEKKNFRLVIFEGGDHFLRNHRKEVDEQRKLWLDKYLLH
jgi:dipeptidyl aminopeptidase/acylaminoacyl peptidase